MPADSHLVLTLACGCAMSLVRRQADETLALDRFDREAACRAHAAPPAEGTPVRGFGPYPDWSANVAMRVQSLPEAGGMIEREHAFILDGQYAFLGQDASPRPVGPIRDAAWVDPLPRS